MSRAAISALFGLIESGVFDHRLVEFAAGIPSRYKVRRLRLKHILKRAFEDVVPREILSRPKIGFSMPLARWLRGELRALAHDLLGSADARVRDFIRPEAVQTMLHQHDAGIRNWHIQLWRLLVLETWLQARKRHAHPRLSQHSS